MTTYFRALKWPAAAALAALLFTSGNLTAHADDIANNLDGSIDAIAEVMALTAGGANGTTTLYVTPTNGDGKSGCNLTGSTTLAVSLTSSNTAAATVSPSSVTFTSCGDTKQVTVTPVAAGSTTITLSQTSNNTGGSFSLAPATFTVNVTPPAPTNTPPTVHVTGVIAGDSYEYGKVPSPGCQVTDKEDGPSNPVVSLSDITGPHAQYGLGTQTATCTYTDAGGDLVTESATYSIVDTTDPVITFKSRTAANHNGWNNSDVTVTWSCSDNVAVEEAEVSTTLSAEAENQSATGTCTDIVGRTASATVSGINIDKTLPTITPETSPVAATTGWWNLTTGAPTVSYTCGDDRSGVASCSGSKTFGEGTDQTDTGTAVDKAGNSSSVEVTGIDVDLTAPAITWTGGPAKGASYYFGQVPATATCAATDDLSGPKDCTISGYGTTVGTHSMTATAHDVAGNVTTETRTYTVLAWTLGGFYQPVDMGDVWNTVKNGSTVPLKFEVFAGATELTDTAVVDSFAVKSMSCSVTTNVDDVEFTTTGGTSLRYDTTAGQFVQNWQTPKTPGACYQVTMTTDDGSHISANFKLK